ncbi:MAG: hypothetical protein ACF8Q5_15025 [Phycisphaerales bacterium JB040]
MNEQQQRAFDALVKRLSSGDCPPDPAGEVPQDLGDDTMRSLLYALLQTDATTSQALNAIGRIHGAVVDINELRIAYPDEIAGMLGPRYPKVAERSERIRAVLCDVFKREHELSLASLHEMPKREARSYLEGLEGMPLAAALRVGLTAFSIHGVPVDDRLGEALIAEGVFEQGRPTGEMSGSLERAVRAADSLDTVLRLEAWADGSTGKPRRKSKPAGQTAKGR